MSKQFLDSEGLALVAGHVNGKLGKATTMPSNPKNGQTVLYIGETDTNYTKGHIYQYSETNTEWVDISPAGGSVVVDQTYNPTSANAQSGTAVKQAVDSVVVPYTAVAYDDFDPSSLTPGVLYLVY